MSHTRKKNYILYSLKEVKSWDMTCPGIVYTDVYKKFGWVPSYYTREQLINRLAINYYYNKEYSILNNIVDELHRIIPGHRLVHNSLFGNTYIRYDTVYCIGYFDTDSNVTIINKSNIEDDVMDAIKSIKHKKDKREKEAAYNKKANQYKFRKGNVPCIGHCKWHRGTYYRIPKLKNIKVHNESCEADTKEFEKAKYRTKNLPVWDDRCRHLDKSWKTSCKIKKQWMKHLDKHIDFDKPMENEFMMDVEA